MRELWSGLRLLTGVLVVGFLLNFAWEMAQLPAYMAGNGEPYRMGFLESALHCFVPTLGDIVVVGLTFLLGWAIHARPDWIRALDWRDSLLVSLTLVLLAIIIEMVAVDRLGRWQYSDLMPIVPLVQVGLLPTIQLALLTVLTFVIVGRFIRRQAGA